ncbi:carbamoyl-phosphate synthase, small subunit [Ruminiclostridium papyrosolvens DSM 2782]|uniref:Carbamoyl phosphate synthase small chain n=1 Tax=Ruminiclostridium papyrosolvens DSM 2782 TaxID=588581 RepID=F1TGT0_9FIRM|nr:glutamine-hydrolyzing carbamoyl-phosphate synthase small subunit [Ruminiclostridium papyrosolvens]EGD46411.1 carbamoyl-phosphate synthase, small subunit [Ruminiclostridium papyrosolvens DSM 2782]WES33976.1 glutamine-hydrolyzing carbamoyl-phosphate synthase small subunit [Ruminiclostridium papyrosolvens DSM 2782]
MKAVLLLEDGTYFSGEGFGKSGETAGEIVFNTCMTGYQEITTDPSYNGQIVTMTYPLIGNYGFNSIDNESYKPHVQGFIVKELCSTPSNWRNDMDADQYFAKHNIVGIKSIDTRALTQHIRKHGSMYGIISTECGNLDTLHKNLENYKSVPRNLVMEVTSKTPTHISGSGKKVVLLDFGVKSNIIRSLESRDCDIHILPAFSTFDEIMEFNPDGILLSNGPGDPRDLTVAKKTVQKLLGLKPIMGICLGHQLLGLSLGCNVKKLKFGHHGGNHPVKDYITGRCYITSQNHNYAIDSSSNEDIVITHRNVNDDTIEGFRHKTLPLISVQYHPEAAPGPQDSAYIFDDFVKML